MKFLQILVVVLFSHSVILFSDPVQSWNRVATPTFAQLNRCSFPDTLNGWAAGDSGTIIHTTDGGLSWFKQTSTIDFSINDIFFLNPRLGWCIANDFFYSGTMILRTTNGGVNWTGSRYPDTTYIINTVYFTDSLNGFLGGYNGLILKTTNAGSTWAGTVIGENNFSFMPIRRINMFNSQFGLACGGIMDVAGIIWRTTDFGSSWNIMDTTFEPLYDVKYFNSNRAAACGGDYEYGSSFCNTQNSGINWYNRTIGFFGIGNAIGFRNSNELWSPLGFSAYWMLSLDSGNTWSYIHTPDTAGIFDAVFKDPSHGWACGQYGSVYKFNPLIGIKKISTGVPSAFHLSQNYPNPFNPLTTIKFSIRGRAHVNLEIYDMLGKKIEILFDSYLNTGYYSIVWNGAEYSSGVYFVVMTSGNYKSTKKMVLSK